MDTKPRRSTPADRVGPCFAGLVFLAYAVVLLGHRSAPSLTDFANWTYQGVLLRNHLLGHPDPAHLLKHYPVPNSAATVGIGLLAFILPWSIAAKAWLIAQLALTFAALRHLARTIRAGMFFWLVLPQAVFLNINFWYGFVNFQLGLCWVLLTASLLLRRQEGSEKDWPLGLILLLAFFTHMFAFAFCGLLILMYCRQVRRWKLLWQLIPGAMLSVWYLLGRFLSAANADGQAGMAPAVRDYSAAFWAFKANTWLKSFGFVNPGGGAPQIIGHFAYLTLMVLNVSLAGVIGWMLFRGAQKAWRTNGNERFIWIAALILLPCFVLVPGTALGVSDPGARLLQLALAASLPLCATAAGWPARVAGFCALALTAMGLFLFAMTGFLPHSTSATAAGLPRIVAEFAHIPNQDQDYFYRALDRDDNTLPVFPTGIFLNRP